MITRVFVPVFTTNEGNRLAGRHWSAKANLRKAVHEAVGYALIGHAWPRDLPKPTADYPYDVVLTRVTTHSPRMDDDSLASAGKAVRDAVALFLGVDDKHRHIVRYSYDQARGEAPGVLITFMARQTDLAVMHG